MTRVRPLAATARAMRARRDVAKESNIGKHKIIMESVTQEKKKLRSVISFEAKAPPGYTFIPAGNPQFTNACKEICRKSGYKVFTVSTTPHQRSHDLSQQVHRIGYHFPSVIVAKICMERGLVLTATGKVIPHPHRSSQASGRVQASGKKADSTQTQGTINTEARDAIKDLFPNIPKKDLGQIIKTAFQKGKRKVGTAVELPLARRVQLAVVAHIRHIYTDYDKLLRVTSFQEARTAVEEPTLAKLVQWRGDDENGKVELEDVFREVIVISDDEDDESDNSEVSPDERDASVEIVSSNTIVGELQTRPVNYDNYPSTNQDPNQEPSDDEAPPPGFRFVPEPARRRRPHKDKVDRRGFSRYQAWNRAMDKYKGTSDLPPANPPATQFYPPHSLQSPVPAPAPMRTEGDRPRALPAYGSSSTTQQPVPFSPHFSRPVNSHQNSPSRIAPRERGFSPERRAPPDVIRLTDGTVFERADRHEDVPSQRTERPLPLPPPARQQLHSEEVKYRTPRDPLQYSGRHDLSGHDHASHVLPSIEGPPVTEHLENHSLDHRPYLVKKYDPREMAPRQPNHRPVPTEDSSGRADLAGINDNRHLYPQKRNKVEHDNVVSEHYPTGSRGTHLPTSDADPAGDQGRILFPLGSRRQGPDGRPLSPVVDKGPHNYHQHPEDHNLRVARRPAADMQPVHGVSHNKQVSGELVDHRQTSYIPLAPHNFSRSDGSGYIPQNNNPPIRSRPISHFVPSEHKQPQPDYFDEREVRGTQGRMVPANRPVRGRSASPGRQVFMSDPNSRRANIYAPDFVRPVQLQDSRPEPRYETRISGVPEQKPGATSDNERYPPPASTRFEAGNRYMPSNYRAFRSPTPRVSNSNVDNPFTGHRVVARPPRTTQHPDSNAVERRHYTPKHYDSRNEFLDGRSSYAVPDNPHQRIYQPPPTRAAIVDDRSNHHDRIPARNEIFVTGDQ